MSKSIFIKGISFSYIRQLLSLVIGIFTIPLMLNYFGSTFFGIWFLIIGLTAYINNIAFGIPTAMSTLVAKEIDREKKFNILIVSVVILSLLSLFFLVLFLIFLWIDTSWIIRLLGNIANPYIETTKNIFIFFVIVTLLRIPLNLFIQFFIGMNLVFISEIYQTLNLVLSFIVLLLTIWLGLDIYLFALLTLGVQFFLGLIALLHVSLHYKFFRTNKKIDNDTIKKVLISGFAFFQVGIAASLVWSTDNLVISHFLSPEYVTPYTIAFKMFTYIFIFSAMVNGVIGPIYGNADSIGDFEKIRKYASMILRFLVIIGGLVWFSLLFFAKEIIIIWAGSENAFGGYLLVFSLGMYGYILSFVNTYATVVFSLNFANKTVWIAWSEAIVNLIISIILVQYFGIGGVALATAFAAFSTAFLYLPKKIRELTGAKVTFEYDFIIKHFMYLVVPMVFIGVMSIYLDSFLVKLIVYITILVTYLLFTWNLIGENDKKRVFQMIKKGTL